MTTLLRAAALFTVLALNACAATSSGRTFAEPGAAVGGLGAQPGGFGTPPAAEGRAARTDYEIYSGMQRESAGIREVRDREYQCMRCN